MKEERGRIRVVESYTASCSDPLCASKGEALALGKHDDEFPGWIWCTDPRGKSSWTPESYLEIHGDHAILLRDYDARELTVNEGDILSVECEESGWLLCTTDSGEHGWIPKRAIEFI
ncbi:MAG: SH3 domain-containing protein [bacterium]|nr:SH3 domain-containing protein [bacterium]